MLMSIMKPKMKQKSNHNKSQWISPLERVGLFCFLQTLSNFILKKVCTYYIINIKNAVYKKMCNDSGGITMREKQRKKLCKSSCNSSGNFVKPTIMLSIAIILMALLIFLFGPAKNKVVTCALTIVSIFCASVVVYNLVVRIPRSRKK